MSGDGDPTWFISDIIKSLIALGEIGYGIYLLRKNDSPATFKLTLRRFTTFTAVALLVWFLTIHDPGSAGWQFYTVLQGMITYLSLIIAKAQYAAANLTTRLPVILPKFLKAGVSICLIAVILRTVGTLVTNSFNWAAVLHVTTAFTTLTAGGTYLFNLIRLRSLIFSTWKNVESTMKNSLNVQSAKNNSVNPFSKSLADTKSDGNEPYGVANVKLNSNVSYMKTKSSPSSSTVGKAFGLGRTFPTSPVSISQSTRKPADRYRPIIRRLNRLICIGTFLLVVVSYSFAALAYLQFRRRDSVQTEKDDGGGSWSEVYERENENYDPVVDFGLYLSAAINGYFQLYAA
eukprot:jgi/Bigna1/140926/aug1.59_g15634